MPWSSAVGRTHTLRKLKRRVKPGVWVVVFGGDDPAEERPGLRAGAVGLPLSPLPPPEAAGVRRCSLAAGERWPPRLRARVRAGARGARGRSPVFAHRLRSLRRAVSVQHWRRAGSGSPQRRQRPCCCCCLHAIVQSKTRGNRGKTAGMPSIFSLRTRNSIIRCLVAALVCMQLSRARPGEIEARLLGCLPSAPCFPETPSSGNVRGWVSAGGRPVCWDSPEDTLSLVL
ncbi:uncharacterized protein PRD47_009029 [Ara ararauna]